MPQIFKSGPYLVYFWINESDPLEPIHVHIAQGRPSKDATKVWLTRGGGCCLAHNHGNIPSHVLHNLMDIIETRHAYIELRWRSIFGTVSYYC